MTALKKPVKRVTNTPLDGSFGLDRNRRIAVTLIPGNGKDVADLFELRPLGTRRPERIAIIDVYRAAMRSRVNREPGEGACEERQGGYPAANCATGPGRA